MTLRILIADDQEMVRAGLRMILETQDDFEVVAEASDGAEAVALAGDLSPDVCLIDIRMPGMDGSQRRCSYFSVYNHPPVGTNLESRPGSTPG